MECLDANAVQSLMSGALDDHTRAVAVKHLDGCNDCRSLVSLLAKEEARSAAIETLSGGDGPRAGQVDLKALALAATEGKQNAFAAGTTAGMGETMPSDGKPLELDPLGITADVSLIRQSGMRQIGKTFGKYTLKERIGAGAMGVVYKAEDPALGRKVALKLLHKPDEMLAKRLVQEAKSMAQVNHPNVVQVYDAGMEEGSTYIAMELVTGSSLRGWISEKKPTQPQIIEAYVAAGRGLAAAHAAGIIHRDFKPDNCLVGGADGRVRVTDFGLASARPNDDGPDTPEELELTNSGMVLGTPAYMAPEQFTGGNVDPRTDQFNYCVALYEALYGQRPFKGKTFDELGDNVCDGKIRPPPPGSRVTGALRAILVRGLSVKPGDRYPTMDHLLDDLGRDRARIWRNTGFVAAALAIALGLGLGADFMVRGRISSSNAQSFDATGVQINRAFGLLVDRFDANANQMYYQAAINEVRSHKDEADFGFGDEAADRKRLGEIHEQLASQDWKFWKMLPSLQVGVIDYKKRLLFSTLVALPDKPWGDKPPPKVESLPGISQTFAGTEKTLFLLPTTADTLPTPNLFGKPAPWPLALCFTRAMVGSGETKEVRGVLLQAIDAKELINEIRLDEKMLLSIVSNDGLHVGQEIPDALLAAAASSDGVVEITHAGKPYQVRRVALSSLAGDKSKSVGSVVMARELGGVLSGLFPNARLFFVIAAFGALAAAIATFLRARQLAR